MTVPDEAVARAHAADLDAPAYWVGGAPDQHGEGNQGRWFDTEGSVDICAGPQARTPTEWLPARTLAGERCYLPRVYLRRVTPEHPDLPAFKYEPSGSAVAFTRDAAVMTGFLEVIERDAASIWWQGRVVRRCVDLDTLDDENIKRFLD
jgi:ribosomal protein S12 methylthiotransferase accessory factor